MSTREPTEHEVVRQRFISLYLSMGQELGIPKPAWQFEQEAELVVIGLNNAEMTDSELSLIISDESRLDTHFIVNAVEATRAVRGTWYPSELVFLNDAVEIRKGVLVERGIDDLQRMELIFLSLALFPKEDALHIDWDALELLLDTYTPQDVVALVSNDWEIPVLVEAAKSGVDISLLDSLNVEKV